MWDGAVDHQSLLTISSSSLEITVNRSCRSRSQPTDVAGMVAGQFTPRCVTRLFAGLEERRQCLTTPLALNPI